ncbi:exonuclease mut-7 homolog [Pelodytes ibericus]
MVEYLKDLWFQKRVEEMQKSLKLLLPTLEDPYVTLVDLLECCVALKGKGNSLGCFIANEFKEWLTEHSAALQFGLRLRKLQARLFSLFICGPLMDVICEMYQFHMADKVFLLGQVTHLHDQGKYTEAAILSTTLDLQPDLNVEDMCAPLILMDKFAFASQYVAKSPELQVKLAQMLDRWTEPDFDPRIVARKYKGLPSAHLHKLTQKPINRMVVRLLEQYKLDPAICPNVANNRHLGTLKFLMYKRFVEKTMSHLNWKEHVQNIVKENHWLQEQVVRLLVRHCGSRDAGRWAMNIGLPVESLPRGVADLLPELSIDEPLSDSESFSDNLQDRKNRYYQVPVPREQIHFVESCADLRHCRELLLKDKQVVGVDMEWRPQFGDFKKPAVCLVQLAVKEEVFLLDLLPGTGHEETTAKRDQLIDLIKDLFLAPEVTKLGFDILGDLHHFGISNYMNKGSEGQIERVIDLNMLHRQLQRIRPGRSDEREVEVFGCFSEDGYSPPEKGLSQLVKELLGKPLDKTEQISNWENRPLRESQILYAAADAYCLLDVYEYLCLNAKQLGIHSKFVEYLKGNVSSPHTEKKSQKRTETRNSRPHFNQAPLPPPNRPLSPGEFAVVCDNMLQGLGRYLRCLGADVLMLDNVDDHRRAAEIARRDGRVILTCGLPYQTLRSQVGEGKCFLVNCSDRAKEQAISVLKHFHVRVTTADIFSRCQACNCNQYLHITKDKMACLLQLQSYLKEEETAPSTPNRPVGLPSKESRRWMEEFGLSAETLVLPSGARLQLETIPDALLDKVELFLCCSQCGKVFWEGSHFGRLVSQFKEVIEDTEGDIYHSTEQRK